MGGASIIGPEGRKYYADRGINIPAQPVESVRVRRKFKFIFVPDIGAVEIVTDEADVLLEVNGGYVPRTVFTVYEMRSDMAGNGEMYWLHEVDQNVFKLRERE